MNTTFKQAGSCILFTTAAALACPAQAQANECLDVPKASVASGTPWHQWDCHYNNNQLFKLVKE